MESDGNKNLIRSVAQIIVQYFTQRKNSGPNTGSENSHGQNYKCAGVSQALSEQVRASLYDVFLPD